MSAAEISMAELPKKTITVNGKTMAYVELGGDGESSGESGESGGAQNAKPIIFQHGNPTSSYLWRNVMPHLQDQGRCIAIDLIGMGDSDKLEDSGPERYTLAEQQSYFDAALDALGVKEDVTLVLHDWGTALGFDWARRHPDAVLGIAHMEGIVMPVSWGDWPEAARGIFQGFRSEAGEEMILEKNLFIERVLPGSVIRKMREEEMAVYRRPFLNPGEDRRPTLTWPRQIPVGGEPEASIRVVEAYAKWLSESPVPKLFINAEPGAILIGKQREFCRSWPNQEEVTVAGTHFIQEDSPHEIGEAIAAWRRRIVS